MSSRSPFARHAPLLLAFAWLACTAWLRPLALPDEGRYVGVAWEMLRSGDWLVPRLDGLPYFHKPPLFYWITAAGMALFGPQAWATRLAPWLAACCATGALYLFSMRWSSARVARVTLLVAVTQPLVFVGAQFANLDMLVAGCIGTCVLAFAHASLVDAVPSQRRAALAAGYLFAALGVLAKGLIGLVLPGLIVVLWLALGREWRLLGRLLWLPGLLLFLAVAAPWLVLMQRQFDGFAHYFFVVQHFSRFAQGGFNNQQPFYFYALVIGVLALPWSLWLPAARGPRSGEPPVLRSVRRLAWIWILAVTLFFSLPQSKLVGYILPVCWPLALLVGLRIGAAPGPAGHAPRWSAISAVLGGAACIAAIALSPLLPQKSIRELGAVLAGKAQPDDRIVLLHEYAFDLPFYARLQQHLLVVEDWEGEQARRDNWRRELADAGSFDPALAHRLLLAPSLWTRALCDGRTTWVIGNADSARAYPLLRLARVQFAGPRRTLWEVPARASAVLHAAGCDAPAAPAAPVDQE